MTWTPTRIAPWQAREEVRSGIAEAESGVAIAKANLELAQVTFKRINELYEKRSISNQEFDEASAKLKAAQAGFEMARAKRVQLDSKLAQADQEVRGSQVTRSYAEIQAPFAGIVTAKSVEPGNLAAPGVPLLTIERDGYRLEASVEESKLATIRLGQSVFVTLDGINRRFDARVSEIVPAVDAASRTYTVKIDLPADADIAVRPVRTSCIPLGSPPGTRNTFGGCHRTRPTPVSVCGRWRCSSNTPDHGRPKGEEPS